MLVECCWLHWGCLRVMWLREAVANYSGNALRCLTDAGPERIWRATDGGSVGFSTREFPVLGFKSCHVSISCIRARCGRRSFRIFGNESRFTQ